MAENFDSNVARRHISAAEGAGAIAALRAFSSTLPPPGMISRPRSHKCGGLWMPEHVGSLPTVVAAYYIVIGVYSGSKRLEAASVAFQLSDRNTLVGFVARFEHSAEARAAFANAVCATPAASGRTTLWHLLTRKLTLMQACGWSRATRVEVSSTPPESCSAI